MYNSDVVLSNGGPRVLSSLVIVACVPEDIT